MRKMPKKGILPFLSFILAPIYYTIQTLATIDFVVEKTENPGWIGVMIDFLMKMQVPPIYMLALFSLSSIWLYIAIYQPTIVSALKIDGHKTIQEYHGPDYRKLNEFTLREAAYLWCKIPPPYKSDAEFPDNVVAKLMVFREKIRNKMLNVNPGRGAQAIQRAMALAMTDDWSLTFIGSLTVTRYSLEQLAISMNEKPEFLFPSKDN